MASRSGLYAPLTVSCALALWTLGMVILWSGLFGHNRVLSSIPSPSQSMPGAPLLLMTTTSWYHPVSLVGNPCPRQKVWHCGGPHVHLLFPQLPTLVSPCSFVLWPCSFSLVPAQIDSARSHPPHTEGLAFLRAPHTVPHMSSWSRGLV